MLTQVETLRDSELWMRDENNRGRALGSRPFGSAYSVPEDAEGGADGNADDATAANTAANSARTSARNSSSYRSSRSSRTSTPKSDDGSPSASGAASSPKRASRRESMSLADEIMKLNDLVQQVIDWLPPTIPPTIPSSNVPTPFSRPLLLPQFLQEVHHRRATDITDISSHPAISSHPFMSPWISGHTHPRRVRGREEEGDICPWHVGHEAPAVFAAPELHGSSALGLTRAARNAARARARC